MSQDIIDSLQGLVSTGDIKSYLLQTVNEEGEVVSDNSEGFRNSDRLTITFPSGNILMLETCCSGSSENTSLMMTSFLPSTNL